MPRNYYRLEVRLETELKTRLERLRRESESYTKKKVSMNALVSQIIESYLDRLPKERLEEEK
ncbi:MAG: hypothetical protein E6R04_05110 [Spirochaetes bacterium]|jgi:hypothetical protein|nr:MAG: hypothetical protein E6R04_05110 [Spirochaetota bacterium]